MLDVEAFILVGGMSSRMGKDKSGLRFGDRSAVALIAASLEVVSVAIRTVGGALPAVEGLVNIADAHDQWGPLAGIEAALCNSNSEYSVIVACDLPYLSAKWLEWLLSRALRSRGEAVVPRTERGIEPLAAVYRRECGRPIAAAYARGVRKVSDAIKELRMDFVYPREWRRIDPNGLVLRNMNAPGDYEEALKWWAAERLSENEHVRKLQRAPKRQRRSAPRRRK